MLKQTILNFINFCTNLFDWSIFSCKKLILVDYVFDVQCIHKYSFITLNLLNYFYHSCETYNFQYKWKQNGEYLIWNWYGL